MEQNPRRRTAARVAWGALAYTVLVILWGGFVRASGAGAGCGDHWPDCNGELIPRDPSLNTMIEFGHRVTSGIALPLVLVVLVLVWRAWPRGAFARKAAVASVAFMLLEAAIGAGLVLFEYVAFDTQVARGYWMAAHLANTLLLLAAMTLTARAASGAPPPRFGGLGRAGVATWVALGSVFVLGISGAVTALGDTLTLAGGISPEDDAFVATLVGLRVLHPTLAFVALGAVGVAVWASRDGAGVADRVGLWVLGGFGVQMLIGAVNVWLRAPVWLQIVHLLVTDVIWIALVVFAARVATRDRALLTPTAGVGAAA